MKAIHICRICTLLALFPSLPLALADPLVVNADEKIDPEQVARILNPQQYQTRSINPAARPTATSVAVRIPFAFNSAKLEPQATSQLEGLADGIKIAGVKVVLEGHTDSIGRPDYNKSLSLKRASAVRQVLVAQYGVAPEAVRAVGYGKARPLPSTDPKSPENRRVELRADN